MKKPLRVLIIEDSEADTLLLARQLRKGGYDPAITRVENAAALATALRDTVWDIVIADYRLPQFSGPAALEMVQAHGRDVPFILVSGVIGEEQAVTALKAGAHDFILKDKLARLVPAVERELREAEVRRQRRQAQEELQHHLQQLRRLVEGSLQVMTAGTRAEVLKQVAEAALALTSARLSAASYGHRPGSSQVAASARAPDAPPCPPGEMLLTSQPGIFAELIGKHPTLRLNATELRAHPGWRGLPEGHVPLRGLLGMRLAAADGQPDGFVLVSDKASGEDFTAADESWLQQLTALASLALQRVDARDGLENKVRERTRELVMANAALQRLNRALRTLSECNQALVAATTEGELLDRVCHLLVRTGGYSGAWVGFAEADERQSVRPVAQAGLEDGHLDTLSATWADNDRDGGPVGTAIRTRKPCLHHLGPSGPGPYGKYAAVLALPLQTPEKRLGVLMMYASSPEAFDADEINLLTGLANDLAFGLGALRIRLERDHATQSLEKWAQLFKRAHWGVAVSSADGAVLEMMNPAYARMHGYSAAELAGAHVLTVYAPECRSEVAEQIRLAHEKGRAIFESRNLRKDGTSFPALVDMSAVRDELGRVLYLVVYTQDISELKSLEARILDISEREQRRMGQDLHDSLCQQLTGIAYLCQTAQAQSAKTAPQEHAVLTRMSQLLEQAVDQARRMAHGLHPVESEANGLGVALHGLVRSFRDIYGLSARFICAKPVLIADNAVATHLYRIAQEAMSNAVKHGRASRIIVRLSETKHAITLSVADNGSGFPTELPESGGLGLKTMQFRARAIGADLDIRRGSDGGTVLRCAMRKRNHA